jgi:hypothetical protein
MKLPYRHLRVALRSFHEINVSPSPRCITQLSRNYRIAISTILYADLMRLDFGRFQKEILRTNEYGVREQRQK